MATTSGGLPYPVGTDKVVDGDNQIRALAEAVDARTAAPRYREFTLLRAGVPTGAQVYNLDATQTYAAPKSFVYSWDQTAHQFTLSDPGTYLISASVYIDWGNGGTGANLKLMQKTGTGTNDFLGQSAYGGGQNATLTVLVRLVTAAAFQIAAAHNSGATMDMRGIMRIMKFGT